MHPCEAVARRRWAKIARIGYAIRQARRDRAPRLPICSNEFACTILVCGLITYTLADFSPEFDRVLRRARDAGDFDFSAVPVRGPWGWRRRAHLAGYR